MNRTYINLTPAIQAALNELGAKIGTKSFEHTLAVACAVTDCLTASDPAMLAEIRSKVVKNTGI